MSGNYKNFLKLLENWPLDTSRVGRDLSQHIRDQIKIAFSKGEAGTQVNQAQCDRYYASLVRLSSNEYGNRYKRKLNFTASGLTHDQCNLALTPELQEEFQRQDLSLYQKLKIKMMRA